SAGVPRAADAARAGAREQQPAAVHSGRPGNDSAAWRRDTGPRRRSRRVRRGRSRGRDADGCAAGRAVGQDRGETVNERTLRVTLRIELPAWVEAMADTGRPNATDPERMRLAIALARENVERRTGGPFGAAVFEPSGSV